MKPNAVLTQILKHFRPRHLEEAIKGNKSARGEKKGLRKYWYEQQMWIKWSL